MMSAKSKKGSPEKQKVYAAEREREGGTVSHGECG